MIVGEMKWYGEKEETGHLGSSYHRVSRGVKPDLGNHELLVWIKVFKTA